MTRSATNAASELACEAWLGRLIESVPLARAGTDPEGVHQIRVACARLDAWLRMGGRRVLRDDLRWLRHAASGVRDHDVLLRRKLPPPIVAWLGAERETARARLLAAFDSPRFTALLRALPLLAPVPRERALDFERSERRKVAARGRALQHDDVSIEALHRLRRTLRRLRYAREAVGMDARRIEDLQDELGRINDAATALRMLERCPRTARRPALHSALAEEVRDATEGVRKAWLEKAHGIVAAEPVPAEPAEKSR
jgi:CHAD domain-containing protein